MKHQHLVVLIRRFYTWSALMRIRFCFLNQFESWSVNVHGSTFALLHYTFGFQYRTDSALSKMALNRVVLGPIATFLLGCGSEGLAVVLLWSKEKAFYQNATCKITWHLVKKLLRARINSGYRSKAAISFFVQPARAMCTFDAVGGVWITWHHTRFNHRSGLNSKTTLWSGFALNQLRSGFTKPV